MSRLISGRTLATPLVAVTASKVRPYSVTFIIKEDITLGYILFIVKLKLKYLFIEEIFSMYQLSLGDYLYIQLNI